MTKRITSEDCEGNIEDIEDGRYNTHVVPVSAEDDPGYEDIDYGDCTEFTVPLGRYGSHVVPIGGAGGGVSGAACPNGGLKAGTNIDGKDCLSLNLKPGGAIILEGGQLAIDTSKLKITTDQVFPSGTDTGIVISGPDGETWDTQADYNNWLYEDQERQDERIEEVDQASKARDLLLEAEILLINSQVNGKQKEKFVNSDNPGDNPYPGYKIKDDKTITFNQNPWEPLPKVGDKLKLVDSQYAEQEIDAVSSLYQDSGPYTLIDVTLRFGVWGLEHAQVGSEATFELESAGIYVTPDELAEDQQRQDEEIEKRVKIAGDTMTGDLKVEADVHANRFRSRFVDSGEQSNLNLQYNGATKVYVGGSEVTIQPPLQLNTEGVDQNHAVTKGYIDAVDEKQAAEINTLEYKLDALVGLTFKGTYEFKHNQTCEEEYQECMANCIGGDARCETDCLRDYSVCEGNTVDPGYFEAIDPDGRFDHLQEIVISKNDKNGVEIEWASVLDAGDYLEVDHFVADSLDKTNYGLYRITEEPIERTNSKGEKVYDMKLQFLQGDGVLNQKELYEIRGITAAEGVNPEELGDFLTKDDAASLYAPKSHNHSGSHITSGTVSINRLPVGTTSSTVARGDHTHSNSGGFITVSHGYKTTYDSNQGASGSNKWMARTRSYTDGHLSNSNTYDSFKRLGQITFRGNDSKLIGKCGQVGTLVASTTSASDSYVYLVFQIYKHTSGTSSGVKWDTFTGVITWMREKDRPENDYTTLGDSQPVYWTWHGAAA